MLSLLGLGITSNEEVRNGVLQFWQVPLVFCQAPAKLELFAELCLVWSLFLHIVRTAYV